MHELLDNAARRILGGEVVILPTETFYGLGTDPRNRFGMSTLLALKTRQSLEGVPLIIDKAERISEWIDTSEGELTRSKRLELQREFWPGPLTLVISTNSFVREEFHEGVFGRDFSLGVRWSSDPIACQLASRLQGVITATSANPKGLQAPLTALQAKAYFPNLFLVQGPVERESHQAVNVLPSTLIDVREFPFRIIRPGAISESQLAPWIAA